MAGRRKRTLAKISALRQRIDGWRRTRTRGRRMPEELWEASTDLALRYGASRVARDLGLNYQRLLERAGRAQSTTAVEIQECSGGGFLELAGAQLASPVPSGETVIELADTDGARMVIRQPAREEGLDLEELAASFWGRSS